VAYSTLGDFVRDLEASRELVRVHTPVDPVLEATELCLRSLRAGGPALLFENPKGAHVPLLGNLFGSTERVARAIGRRSLAELREVGQMLAFLKEPRLPRNLREVWRRIPDFRRLLHLGPRLLDTAPCRDCASEGPEVDLAQFPIQRCWPEDAGRLITWGLVVTKGPYKERQNIGVYRQQVLAKNKVIMRWLQHRGGALDFREFQAAHPGKPFPLAVAIGADPATLLAAATPIPDTMSEFEFAGLLRGSRSDVIPDRSGTLWIPASAEIVLEGHIYPGETALEGPFGDHTGYYNEPETFPVFTVERVTHRARPLYYSSYTGRSPHDEPSVLAMALNEIFIPILQRQFPEIVDFYLPPEGCSYRMACVSIKKAYPGHARRIMFAVWSYLRQFTYTKFVIVTDDDIDVRRWPDVIWAMSTRMDPARDTFIAEHTPIDYLDFASATSSLGGKIGFDATNKWPGETARAWGRPITMSEEVKRRTEAIWNQLDIRSRQPPLHPTAANDVARLT